jgi:hypothetical protein
MNWFNKNKENENKKPLRGYRQASQELVEAAIATISNDPFYREWFAHKEKFYDPTRTVYFVHYHELEEFSPTTMVGSGVAYLPFEMDGSYYVAAQTRWCSWANNSDHHGEGENLIITQVSQGLFNDIKREGKAFALKLTTGQHNSPWNEEFKQRGEQID